VRPVKDIAIAEKIKQYADEKIVAVFTSRNAVEAVFSRIKEKPEWTICCISGATKDTLLKYVNEDTIPDIAHDASALADKIISDKSILSCVFFCGNKRMHTLPDRLRRQGIELEEVIVYETVLAPKKTSCLYEGILFFSPGAVESFFSVNKIGNATVCFSIGKTTAKAIRKCTGHKIVTADFPGVENLLQLVYNFKFETKSR
jgi:uroporphyrinogen-III synthase